MGDTTNRDEPNQAPSVLELDVVFDALAHPRRRYLLYTLLESDDRSLRRLARTVAAWEENAPPEVVSDADVDRTYVSLYHTHVPKLVESNVVEFDEVAETLTPAANAERLLDLLEAVGGVRDSKQESHARGRNDGGYS